MLPLLSLLLLLSRYSYSVLLRKKDQTLKETEAKKLAGAFGALFSLMCVRYIKGRHYL
jgi:hypothetical protein